MSKLTRAVQLTRSDALLVVGAGYGSKNAGLIGAEVVSLKVMSGGNGNGDLPPKKING
jgi:hypothetical protein